MRQGRLFVQVPNPFCSWERLQHINPSHLLQGAWPISFTTRAMESRMGNDPMAEGTGELSTVSDGVPGFCSRKRT